MHAAQRHDAVVDAVLGQDQERPLGREPAVEQRLGDGADLRARLFEGERAPAPALGRAGALGEEDPLRRFARPAFEPDTERQRGGAFSGTGERRIMPPSARRWTSTSGGAKRSPCGCPADGVSALRASITDMLSSPVRAHLSRRERSSDAEGGVRVRGALNPQSVIPHPLGFAESTSPSGRGEARTRSLRRSKRRAISRRPLLRSAPRLPSAIP